jgi:Ricin-type beta-trefoil lectin domain-like
VNRSTGKCLDTGGLTASGSVLQQWASGSSYNQQWSLTLQ